MTDTNTDKTFIYVFLSLAIVGGLLSVGTAVYFSLRCMHARGEGEPLSEVVVISPAVGLQVGQLDVAQEARRAHHEGRHQPLLSQ